MFRLRAKRTTGSSPPAELLFGEIAFSDANKRLYLGRADGSPCTFESDLSLSPITEAIAALNTTTGDQADAIAAIEVEQGTQNDAIAALNTVTGDQDAAIVTLTASDAAQDTALAALILNDGAQDTAIATLAASSFSGAYADLSGKPTLFSGAYGDLSGKPTIPYGFTYDQQTEPSGPTAGATWRERSAGGLIVGEWEWTGSVWAALQKTTMSGVVANGAATAYPTLYFEAPRCLFVQCRVVINPVGNPATPFNSSNYREVYLGRGATGAGSSVFGYRPLLSLAQGEYSSPMNYFNPSGAPFFTQTAVAGSPGTMNAPGVSWVYREVRA